MTEMFGMPKIVTAWCVSAAGHGIGVDHVESVRAHKLSEEGQATGCLWVRTGAVNPPCVCGVLWVRSWKDYIPLACCVRGCVPVSDSARVREVLDL